ncbi:MAG: alpha/beta fold hydrolase [Candidatus Paceibacterota bacterium]
MKYDHKSIEKKWQKFWSENKIYTTPDSAPGKDNFYLLVEFPYPSGNLHVGHWYAFAVPDILARYERMRGKNVMYPIGFDAFGLPAENAAIKNKLNPRDWTEKNIAYMKKQIESMGTSFDWSREVSTIDPAYYKWTQWLFLQLYKKGLVYQKETAVNWCPVDKTVLANEQVIDGKCDRCGSEVEQRQMLQWNIKITDYADRLIDDLAALDWPEQIKESQRNWIGRSEGAEIDFALDLGANDGSRFLLLHGRQGSPEANFFPWLKSELEARGYEVEVPLLPNTAEPNDEEQADFVVKNCRIDERTVIIGHSFGGVVAMRLLERGHKARRVVFVATPCSGEFLDGKERPSVKAAILKGFDFLAVRKNADTIQVLPDESDPVVPFADAELLAKETGGMLVRGKGTEYHFTAKVEPDVLMMCVPTIRVFTTRPDTLFGATYLVLAPEHPWVTLALAHKTVLKNNDEVRAYVDRTERMSDMDRQTTREKTGVQLKGVDAINPANGEKIPLYIADYVLGHYGTGAIMAVPAHDERDFEFAKKFDLPIKPVVEPQYVGKGEGEPKQGEDFVKRNAVCVVVRNPKDDTYLCISWKTMLMHGLVTGGIEDGEDLVEAAKREVREETGYKNLRLVWNPGIANHTLFYHRVKKQNRWARFTNIFFELENDERDPIDPKEEALHEVLWLKRDKLKDFFSVYEGRFILDLLDHPDYVHTDAGVLHNSGEFDWMGSEEAKKVMTGRFGRKKTTYKLRDWIVSRQRYWGVPIPMIHCEKCGNQPVPDEQLPVLLPDVEDYLPEGSGKSPLAKVKDFVEILCPRCGGRAQRETDTLDTFVDSSWYFLRYLDANNADEFAAREKQGMWMPVNMYSGGAEHTTMHLLYSRFWHKALFDIGLVGDAEPYAHRVNHGLVLGPDGQKMSKSKGNVLDPDEVVERLGADTVRMYLAFMGPYTGGASYPWNPDGVVGVRRFLERVARTEEYVQSSHVDELDMILNKTIQKVGDDISVFKFNTAISQLMILMNAIEKTKKLGTDQWKLLLHILAPFAPHLAEELWHVLGGTASIHLESWPKYDPSKTVDDEIVLAVQVDGKTRGEVRVKADADKATIETAAREAVASRLEGKTVTKTIVVPKRLVNFVLSAS